MGVCGLDLFGSEWRPVAGCCEQCEHTHALESKPFLQAEAVSTLGIGRVLRPSPRS
jgi:hypothetical protein